MADGACGKGGCVCGIGRPNRDMPGGGGISPFPKPGGGRPKGPFPKHGGGPSGIPPKPGGPSRPFPKPGGGPLIGGC